MWEYRVRYVNQETDGELTIEQSINVLGSQGWELVTCVSSNSHHPLLIFKRFIKDSAIENLKIDIKPLTAEQELRMRTIIAEAMSDAAFR